MLQAPPLLAKPVDARQNRPVVGAQHPKNLRNLDAAPGILQESQSTRNKARKHVMDIVFIALGIAFLAATVGLVHAFERLRKS